MSCFHKYKKNDPQLVQFIWLYALINYFIQIYKISKNDFSLFISSHTFCLNLIRFRSYKIAWSITGLNEQYLLAGYFLFWIKILLIPDWIDWFFIGEIPHLLEF